MEKSKVVESFDKFQEILSDGKSHEFFIALNGGAKSTKYISYDKLNRKFCIFSLIDSTDEEYTEIGLKRYTNINDAIKKGNFFLVVEGEEK